MDKKRDATGEDKAGSVGEPTGAPLLGRPPGSPWGSGPGAKPMDFKATLGKMIPYTKSHLPKVFIALLLALFGAAFNIIGPNKIREITDLIFAGMMSEIDLASIGRIGLFLAVLYMLGSLFSYLQGFIMATVTVIVSKTLRDEISQKINRLPLNFFDSKTHGDLLSRVVNDVDLIGQTLNQGLGILVGIVMFFGSLLMMFWLSWIMTLSAIGATLLGFFVMRLIISKSQKYFRMQQGELGRINGFIEEMYSGHNVVKVSNGEKAAKKAFDEINQSLYDNAWRSQFISRLMMPLMQFIGNLGYVAVCVVGAMLVFNGMISFGVIIAFTFYIQMFTQPLSQLAQAATSLQSAVAAGERVFELLDAEEMQDESDKVKILDHIKGDVDFKNVQFGYNKDRIIINDLSLHVHAGQKIAIVGPTGAGKTTIVNLLMRFYELNRGEILIDGVSISTLKRENVHNLFGMVLQDTWLFEGTIKENIIFSQQGVTDEEVMAASKAVKLHHFIQTLPQGYDTILNERASISDGQKQLITIARAMIENAPLLILDEATSSVDTRTEVLIQEAMDKLMAGRTSFVIAHRLSTIKNADLILVMKEGDIVESGNHEELIVKQDFYAELYNSQFDQAS